MPPASDEMIAAPVVYAPPPFENQQALIRTCEVAGPVNPAAWVTDPGPWVAISLPEIRYAPATMYPAGLARPVRFPSLVALTSWSAVLYTVTRCPLPVPAGAGPMWFHSWFSRCSAL